MLIRAALVLLVSAEACAPADARDPEAAGGAPVVESAEPLWKAGEEWRVPLEPAVRIGEAEGDSAYLLSNVVGAGRLADGQIVMADRGTNQVHWYAADGTHRASRGRQGNGPGEFRWIDWMGVAADSVFVWDGFARRLSVYDRTGRLARTLTFRELDDLPFPAALGLMDGMLVLRRRPGATEEPARAGERTDSVTYLLHSVADGGSRGRRGPFLDAERFTASIHPRYMGARVIFGRQGWVAVDGDGFHFAPSDRFEATRHAPDRKPVRVVRRPHQSARASRADVDAWREEERSRNAEVLQLSTDMAAVRTRLMEQQPHRSTLPAVTALASDREGRLWMRGYAAPGAETAEWSVFDAEGRWLGAVHLPGGLQVLEIGDGWVLGRTDGEDDGVQRVVLHTIQRP